MVDTNDKLLIKLKALREKSTNSTSANEREIATRMLNSLLTKHRLDMSIFDEARRKEDFVLEFWGHQGKKLAFQIMVFLGYSTYKTIHRSKSKVLVNMTKTDYTTYTVMFAKYREALDLEIEATFSALAHKNELFGANSVNKKTLSERERKIIKSALSKLDGMSEVTINPLLEKQK